jgi:hypothetical protein
MSSFINRAGIFALYRAQWFKDLIRGGFRFVAASVNARARARPTYKC